MTGSLQDFLLRRAMQQTPAGQTATYSAQSANGPTDPPPYPNAPPDPNDPNTAQSNQEVN